MGGDVSVQSRPRVGTVFTLELPLLSGRVTTAPPAQPTGARDGPREHPAWGSRARSSTTTRTTAAGSCACSRTWASMFARRRTRLVALVSLDELRPSLVLLDTTMPRLDGSAAIRRMRERDQGARPPSSPSPRPRSRRTATRSSPPAPTASSSSRAARTSSSASCGGSSGSSTATRPSDRVPRVARSSSPRSRRGAGTSCRRVSGRRFREATHVADYDVVLELLALAQGSDGVMLDALRGLVETYSYDALAAVMAD